MNSSIRYKELMDNIPGVFFRCACDDNWTMHHMSEGVQPLTDYAVDELVGNRVLSFASLIHPADSDAVDAAVMAAVESRSTWNIEYRLRNRDGHYKWVSEQGIGVYGSDGTVEYLDGFVLDISERKAIEQALHQSEQRIRELAYYDPISGLPNRNLMMDQIESLLSRRTDRQPLGLLFIDLDGFKPVNDVYGHEIGDKVLARIGQRLNALVCAPNLASRIGGDEFMVLCQDGATEADCRALGDRIVESFSEPLDIDGVRLSVGASVGVSLTSDDLNSVKALVSAADMAMYEAKNRGKGQTQCFSQIDTTAQRKAKESLETELVRALKEKQFTLHYQPQVNTQTGDVVSVEALIRWNHPKHGLVPPNEFIPVAEESGLIYGIGNWVLETAVAQLAQWDGGPLGDVRISVNIAVAQFFQGNICGHILGLLERYGVAPSRLEIEVTESTFMSDTELASTQLRALQAAGVRIAIDDFGTGYSCLSYLQDLPLDVLKIDRSFVRRLNEEHSEHSVVHMITQLANGLGLETVAEGVETSDQSDQVADLGCDLIQGFYYAKPQSAEQIESVIADIRQQHVISTAKVA